MVQATDLATLLEGIPSERVNFAQAGGARHRNIEMMFPMELRPALTLRAGRVPSRRLEEVQNKEFPLSRFLSSPAVVIDGMPVSREEIILYVANKLGGAHFDPSRNTEKAKEKKFALLDSHRSSLRISETNAVFFELLSIGQALLGSKDVDRLSLCNRRRRTSAIERA